MATIASICYTQANILPTNIDSKLLDFLVLSDMLQEPFSQAEHIIYLHIFPINSSFYNQTKYFL